MYDEAKDTIRVSDTIYLRAISPSDKERLILLANDPEMRKNLWDTMPFPYTSEDADWWIEHSHSLSQKQKRRQYAIIIDNQYAGNIGRSNKQKWKRSHNFYFGYRLGRPYRWKGIMTQVVAIFMNHMFKTIPNCERIYAKVAQWNTWSARVLEKNWCILEWTFQQSIKREWKKYNELIYAKLRP